MLFRSLCSFSFFFNNHQHQHQLLTKDNIPNQQKHRHSTQHIMSSKILLQFKAGRCFRDGTTNTVNPDATKGYFNTSMFPLCSSTLHAPLLMVMWRSSLAQHLLTHMSSSLSFVDRLVYMEEEDGLLHFFWKNRTTNSVEDVRSTYLAYSHFQGTKGLTQLHIYGWHDTNKDIG